MRELITIAVIILIVAGFTTWVFDDEKGHCVTLYANLYICGDAQ